MVAAVATVETAADYESRINELRRVYARDLEAIARDVAKQFRDKGAAITLDNIRVFAKKRDASIADDERLMRYAFDEILVSQVQGFSRMTAARLAPVFSAQRELYDAVRHMLGDPATLAPRVASIQARLRDVDTRIRELDAFLRRAPSPALTTFEQAAHMTQADVLGHVERYLASNGTSTDAFARIVRVLPHFTESSVAGVLAYDPAAWAPVLYSTRNNNEQRIADELSALVPDYATSSPIDRAKFELLNDETARLIIARVYGENTTRIYGPVAAAFVEGTPTDMGSRFITPVAPPPPPSAPQVPRAVAEAPPVPQVPPPPPPPPAEPAEPAEPVAPPPPPPYTGYSANVFGWEHLQTVLRGDQPIQGMQYQAIGRIGLLLAPIVRAINVPIGWATARVMAWLESSGTYDVYWRWVGRPTVLVSGAWAAAPARWFNTFWRLLWSSRLPPAWDMLVLLDLASPVLSRWAAGTSALLSVDTLVLAFAAAYTPLTMWVREWENKERLLYSEKREKWTNGDRLRAFFIRGSRYLLRGLVYATAILLRRTSFGYVENGIIPNFIKEYLTRVVIGVFDYFSTVKTAADAMKAALDNPGAWFVARIWGSTPTVPPPPPPSLPAESLASYLNTSNLVYYAVIIGIALVAGIIKARFEADRGRKRSMLVYVASRTVAAFLNNTVANTVAWVLSETARRVTAPWLRESRRRRSRASVADADVDPAAADLANGVEDDETAVVIAHREARLRGEVLDFGRNHRNLMALVDNRW